MSDSEFPGHRLLPELRWRVVEWMLAQVKPGLDVAAHVADKLNEWAAFDRDWIARLLPPADAEEAPEPEPLTEGAERPDLNPRTADGHRLQLVWADVIDEVLGRGHRLSGAALLPFGVEELATDAYLIAARRWPEFRYDGREKTIRWLLQILRHLLRRAVRRCWEDPAAASLSGVPAPPAASAQRSRADEREQMAARLLARHAALPPDARAGDWAERLAWPPTLQVFVAADTLGTVLGLGGDGCRCWAMLAVRRVPSADAAAALGMNANAVNQRYFRFLRGGHRSDGELLDENLVLIRRRPMTPTIAPPATADTALGDGGGPDPTTLDEFLHALREDARLRPGDVFGAFTIRRLLRVGGMGEAYLAEQAPLGRPTIVKVVRGGGSAAARARFRTEWRVGGELHHTNLVPVYAAGRKGDRDYYVMPYIRGADLGEVIREVAARCRTPGGARSLVIQTVVADLADRKDRAFLRPWERFAPPAPVPTGSDVRAALPAAYYEWVARRVLEAAAALETAHRAGVLHLDVKPSNVMIETPSDAAKVLDFGLAQRFPVPDAGPAPAVPCEPAGVAGYTAPEVFRGEADRRADVFGLVRASATRSRSNRTRPPRRPTWRRSPARHWPTTRRTGIPRPRRWPTTCGGGSSGGFRPRGAGGARSPARSPCGSGGTSAGRSPRSWRSCWAGASRRGPSGGRTTRGGRPSGSGTAWPPTANSSAACSPRRTRSAKCRRGPGCSTRVGEALRDVRRIRPDADLKDHAAVALAGLDAPLVSEHRLPWPPVNGRRGIGRVAFGPDGRVLAAGWAAGADLSPALLWDGNSARKPAESSRPGPGPVAFPDADSPLQLVLPVGGDGKALALWNVGTGAAEGEVPLPAAGTVGASALSADARSAAVSFFPAHPPGGKAPPAVTALWGIERKAGKATAVKRKEWPGAATVLELSADGQLLAAGSDAGDVVVRAAADGTELFRLTEGELPVTGLAFGRNFRRPREDRPDPTGAANWLLAVGSKGGGLSVWDLRTRTRLNAFHVSEHAVHAAAFSPDGTTLASAGRNFPFLWDVASGRPLLRVQQPAPGGAGGFCSWTDGVAFSADGRHLAFTSPVVFGFGGLNVFRLDDDRGVRSYRGLTGVVEKVWLSPSGKWVAALAQNWQLGVWDRATGRAVFVRDVSGWTADNAAVAFGDGDRELLFASGDRVSRWALPTGEATGRWDVPAGLNDCLAVPLKRKPLLVRRDRTGGRQTVVARELGPDGTTTEVYAIDEKAHRGTVASVQLSADGSTLLVNARVGNDSRALLFDGATGKPVALDQSALAKRSAYGTLTPDGRTLTLEHPPGDAVRSTAVRLADRLVLGSHPRKLLATDGTGKLGLSTSTLDAEPNGLALSRVGEDRPVVTFDIGHPPAENAVLLSGDGRFVAWGRRDGTVRVADVNRCLEAVAPFGAR